MLVLRCKPNQLTDVSEVTVVRYPDPTPRPKQYPKLKGSKSEQRVRAGASKDRAELRGSKFRDQELLQQLKEYVSTLDLSRYDIVKTRQALENLIQVQQ